MKTLQVVILITIATLSACTINPKVTLPVDLRGDPNGKLLGVTVGQKYISGEEIQSMSDEDFEKMYYRVQKLQNLDSGEACNAQSWTMGGGCSDGSRGSSQGSGQRSKTATALQRDLNRTLNQITQPSKREIIKAFKEEMLDSTRGVLGR